MALDQNAGQGGGLKCAQCGEPLAPRDRFCMRCGAMVSQQPPPQETTGQTQVADAVSESQVEAVPAADIVHDDEISDIQSLSGVIERAPTFWDVMSIPLQVGRPGLWKNGLPFTGFLTLGLAMLAAAQLDGIKFDILYWASALPFAEAVRHFTFSITRAFRGELDTGMEKPKGFQAGGFIGSFIIVFSCLGIARGISKLHMANLVNLPGPLMAYLLTFAVSAMFILAIMIIVADACAKEVKDMQFERPNVAQLAKEHWPGFCGVVGFIIVAIPLLPPGALAAVVMSMIAAEQYGKGKDAPENEPLYWQAVRANAILVYTKVAGKIDPEVDSYASPFRHALGVVAAGAAGLVFGWVAVCYWAASVIVRLLVLAYRGERVRFWSEEE